mmetsp:Transcript_21229/g.24420  ORF Transcript_21229/g.24420 Transcript_21229/m.24420 type:complete len:161 (-) Transcript_21229:13-495(-)
MRYIAIAFIFMTLAMSSMTADPAPATGAAAAGPKFTPKEVNNSKELQWELEGENENMYIVNFYMPGDEHDKVRGDLEKQIASNTQYKDKVTYIEVNAARTYQFKDMLQEVGIYNEPARMYPYIVLIKKGQGYLFRGNNIGDHVLRKIKYVDEGTVDTRSA